MSLSLTQALELLANDPAYQTVDGLLELVRLTSVTTPADGVGKQPLTLGWSGNLAASGQGPYSSSFVDYVARTYPDLVRVFPNTPVAGLLNSREFQDAAFRAFSEDEVALDNWLSDPTRGAFAIASDNFMAAAPGDIDFIGPFASGDRILAQTEIAAGLRSAAPNIGGVPATELAEFRNTLLANDLTEADASAKVSDLLSFGSRLRNQNIEVAWTERTTSTGTVKEIAWADLSRWISPSLYT